MSTTREVQAMGKLMGVGLALALGLMAPAPAPAQRMLPDDLLVRPTGPSPGARRCPNCAPRPARAARAASVAVQQGGHTPTTDASITLGDQHYQGRVDADCELRERAPVGGPRAYYMVLYPWFGRPLAPDEAKWRFDLEIRRGPAPGVYQHFVFSFQDGTRSGHIQVLPGATRYGRGSVRVTPHPPGARFDVQGVSDEGVPLRATIDCAAFEGSEAAGG